MSLLPLIIVGSLAWLVLFHLFPGVPNASAECGGGGEEEEAQRQEDIAGQREEVRTIINQFLAQLPIGSEEYNQLQSEGQRLVDTSASPLDEQTLARELGTRLVSQAQARIAAGGPATALEARTNRAFGTAPTISSAGEVTTAGTGFRGVSAPADWEQDIYRLLSGDPTTTAFGSRIGEGLRPSAIDQELLNALQGLETTTPIGRTFTGAVNRAATPTVDDTLFRELLNQVEDRVNTSAAGRGILGGGLRLEDLGRAGTEAAIAEAKRQDLLRQEAYENAIGLYDTGRNINTGGLDFAASLYNAGQGLRERDIGVEAALVDIQLGRETNLTEMLNNNANLRLNDLNRLLERQTSQATADRLDAQDTQATRRAGIGQAIGTGLAVAAAPFTGGASLALAPAAGQIGSSLAGGRTATAPSNAGQFLAAQQASTTSAGQPAAVPLSRQPQRLGQLSEGELTALLRRLGMGA